MRGADLWFFVTISLGILCAIFLIVSIIIIEGM